MFCIFTHRQLSSLFISGNTSLPSTFPSLTENNSNISLSDSRNFRGNPGPSTQISNSPSVLRRRNNAGRIPSQTARANGIGSQLPSGLAPRPMAQQFYTPSSGCVYTSGSIPSPIGNAHVPQSQLPSGSVPGTSIQGYYNLSSGYENSLGIYTTKQQDHSNSQNHNPYNSLKPNGAHIETGSSSQHCNASSRSKRSVCGEGSRQSQSRPRYPPRCTTSNPRRPLADITNANQPPKQHVHTRQTTVQSQASLSSTRVARGPGVSNPRCPGPSREQDAFVSSNLSSPTQSTPDVDSHRHATSEYWDIGNQDYECPECGALMWFNERVPSLCKDRVNRFTLCCRNGQVQLPMMTPPPQPLEDLFKHRHPLSTHFHDNIRGLNGMFSFASMGGTIDHSINQGRAPYTFRMGGQNVHLIGSLLPPTNSRPKFAQLYIYDTEDEVNNRIYSVSSKHARWYNDGLVVELKEMLDRYNPLAKTFRLARDRILADEGSEIKIRLIGSRDKDGRTYNLPTTSEVAALVVGDVGDNNDKRDVIVEYQDGRLKRINELHPIYLPCGYPFLHTRGEDGFRLGIPHNKKTQGTVTISANPHSNVTMREYFAFRIQDRQEERESGHILKAGKLFQQYCVDGYTMVESQRLTFHKGKQKKQRSDNLKNLSTAVSRGETEASTCGTNYDVPSSFVGGHSYYRENYMDTMCICKWYGFPDLFITFTCNPSWPEIARAKANRLTTSNNMPDIVDRVFKIKLDELMKDLKDRHLFGRTKSVVYTIEFQKRGLPHAHIIVFLHRDYKFPQAADVDKIISAELPCPIRHPVLYDLVSKHMMHGPCGPLNPKCSCMIDKKCSQYFPRAFCATSSVDRQGYPLYMRRDTGIVVDKKGIELDNGFVVPYNPSLLMKYRGHINVEWCNQSRSIKYLFKYINKGHDRATLNSSFRRPNNKKPGKVDDIQRFYDCRYISPCEAMWRILGFDIHHRTTPVLRLSFHLPDEQRVVFNEDDPLDIVIERPNIERTMFMAWMEANIEFPEGRHLTYCEYSTKFVYHKDKKRWAPRKKFIQLGRLYYVSPGCGEKYYLRTLLNFVKGATCYEDIRTLDGILYPTFKEACYARGLLGDDKEYVDGIEEASNWGSGIYLRNLFATLLISGSLSQPDILWEKTWHLLSDDILYRKRKEAGTKDLCLSDEQIKNYALKEIDAILQSNGWSLSRFQDMPLPTDSEEAEHVNQLMIDELSFDKDALREEHVRLMSSMTEEQMGIYHVITSAIANEEGGTFFLYGYGGTGKTYIWRTLCAAIRSKGQIVLPVASSGIAAIILPSGRTAHSRFGIAIDIDENSICTALRPGTDVAELLIHTKLIIWDEAPMTNKFAFEALDKSLRDIMCTAGLPNHDKPFGGKVVVFGGDFRQILPVVPKGSRQDIVHASICSSYLWSSCKVLTLTRNMRLQSGDTTADAIETRAFSDWILSVGDGRAGGPNDGEVQLTIDDDLLLDPGNDHVSSIVQSTFPLLQEHLRDPQYFQERAILAPTHDHVEDINNYVLSLIPGEERTYLSSDELSSNENGYGIKQVYTTEFLNAIRCSGLPNHELNLKVGTVVMLIRNINQSAGLCNGTRLIITNLGNHIIRGTVITGSNIGDKVHIPRIGLTPSDITKFPVRFERRQFPIVVCFAMTINKSQGQSLAHVGLYLPRPVFSHGQFYVAISRVTTKKGLKILIFDKDNAISNITTNVVFKEIFQYLE